MQPFSDRKQTYSDTEVLLVILDFFIRLILIVVLMQQIAPAWMLNGDIPLVIWAEMALLILSYPLTDIIWNIRG
jgi:hypothetical protein